jgi:glycosyltransferase involved in cell wall biosynthesis
LAIDDVHTVSVIIPTRALRERGALLRQAIQSVLNQEAVRAVPLLIVNGREADGDIVAELRAHPLLRVALLEEADLPSALCLGRKMVDTMCFAELDDDDILLPGALKLRLRALLEHPDFTAVVTNGFCRVCGQDKVHIPDVAAVRDDPMRALLRQNWLLPGSWLCRTDAVEAAVFKDMPKFLECTYLALWLARYGSIRFIDIPSVVWNADTPRSESKSSEYIIGQAAALGRILKLDLPADVRAEFRNRLTRACHENACRYLEGGNLKNAWAWHFQSLYRSGGARYFSYTARFLYYFFRS